MTKFTPKEYAEKVKTNISKFGYHMTYVVSKSEPSFCYTTGITKSYGLPELFISSLPKGLSTSYISEYIKYFDKGEETPLNKRLCKKDDAPFDFYLVPVNEEALKEYTLASYKFYGSEKFSYLQLIFPDVNLRFPHEEGYDYDQEILGQYLPLKNA